MVVFKVKESHQNVPDVHAILSLSGQRAKTTMILNDESGFQHLKGLILMYWGRCAYIFTFCCEFESLYPSFVARLETGWEAAPSPVFRLTDQHTSL